MKHFYACTLLLTLLFCWACDNGSTTTNADAPNLLQAVADSTLDTIADANEPAAEEEFTDEEFVPLNTIRFKDWTDEDWLDNGYIRELRRYIDAYCRGEEQSEKLEGLEDKLRGKFLVLAEEAALYGGLYICIAFLENPTYIYDAWVYSEVINNRVVSYETRVLSPSDRESGFTKEEILALLKEYPENKLW